MPPTELRCFTMTEVIVNFVIMTGMIIAFIIMLILYIKK
jgi:hypothetical protein